MYQNSHKLTKLSRSPFGLHKLWLTLVHVHIATEVLVTGATGLCFMIWLVTLIGLLIHFSEMIKIVHVFLVKAVNSLVSSHPGPPMKDIWWLYSNSLSRRHVQQNKNGALMHTAHSLSLLIVHSLSWPSDIPVGKHPSDKNIESNHQTSEIVDKCKSGD